MLGLMKRLNQKRGVTGLKCAALDPLPDDRAVLGTVGRKNRFQFFRQLEIGHCSRSLFSQSYPGSKWGSLAAENMELPHVRSLFPAPLQTTLKRRLQTSPVPSFLGPPWQRLGSKPSISDPAFITQSRGDAAARQIRFQPSKMAADLRH